MRARSRRCGVGRRAASGHHTAGESEDVVGVGAGRGGARVRGAVPAHHGAGAARPQALARRCGARRQRAVRARRRRRAARPPSPPPLAQAARLEPIHHGGEIP